MEAGFGIRIGGPRDYAPDPRRRHDGDICRIGKAGARQRSRRWARLSFFAAVAAILSPARSDSPPQREPVAVAGQWLARLRLILIPVPQRVGG